MPFSLSLSPSTRNVHGIVAVVKKYKRSRKGHDLYLLISLSKSCNRLLLLLGFSVPPWSAPDIEARTNRPRGTKHHFTNVCRIQMFYRYHICSLYSSPRSRKRSCAGHFFKTTLRLSFVVQSCSLFHSVSHERYIVKILVNSLDCRIAFERVLLFQETFR